MRLVRIAFAVAATAVTACSGTATSSAVHRAATPASYYLAWVTMPGLGEIPRNVALICQWTWECAAPPRGPNQHADRVGYGAIAGAFLRTAGLQLPLMARRRRRTPPPALAEPAPSLTVQARAGRRTA
jgi:hypothetical protein